MVNSENMNAELIYDWYRENRKGKRMKQKRAECVCAFDYNKFSWHNSITQVHMGKMQIKRGLDRNAEYRCPAEADVLEGFWSSWQGRGREISASFGLVSGNSTQSQESSWGESNPRL